MAKSQCDNCRFNDNGECLAGANIKLAKLNIKLCISKELKKELYSKELREKMKSEWDNLTML